MIITKSTPLYAIAERMGDCATNDDARAMLDELLAAGVTDTEDVSEADWLVMTDRAAATASEDSLVGERVEAGEGADHDTGVVTRYLSATSVEVAWDSQVCTPADVSALRVL